MTIDLSDLDAETTFGSGPPDPEQRTAIIVLGIALSLVVGRS